MGDENTTPQSPTLPVTQGLKDGEVIVNQSDLEAMIFKMVQNMDLGQVPALKALKEEINQVNRKSLFPSGEDGVFETAGKSIIDTSVFNKDYSNNRFNGNVKMDGMAMGNMLKSMKGPFLHLSPLMEKFAIILSCRGNPSACQMKGVDINAYNAECKEINNKIIGEKSLTTTDGGALVPVEYLATVVEFATAQSQILPKVWRLPMGSTTLKIPTLVQAAGSYYGGIQLYHIEEAAQKTTTKPSFDSLTFTAKKLVGLIYLTDEMIMDSSINIINYITGLFVRAFQYRIEGEILSGTGVLSQMLGIINDPGINVVQRQAVGTVGYLDIINLESALDENFNNLTFISRRATVNTLRQEQDTNGQPVYHDGFVSFLGSIMVPQLLGHPLIKTRNVPVMGTQGDIILGDLSYYIWALRQDMTIDTSIHSRFEYDETALRFVMRMDGMPGVSIAFAILDDVAVS